MIVLDANVVMEILDQRRQYQAVLKALAAHRHQNAPAALSTLTVSHVFYLAEKAHIPLDQAEALLASYKTFGVLPEDVAWALDHYKQDDFEDALQVAAALREGCTSFMTLDQSLAEKHRRYLPIELIR